MDSMNGFDRVFQEGAAKVVEKGIWGVVTNPYNIRGWEWPTNTPKRNARNNHDSTRTSKAPPDNA